jgi:hypothetical protein
MTVAEQIVYLQIQLSAAYSNLGVVSTRFGERSVEYSDQTKVISYLESKIAALGGTDRPRQIRMSTDSGY